MRVRTQLILAFLLLAVLPLVGIVFFSYATSQRSFKRAVEAEGRTLSTEMGERLAAVREDLTERLGEAARLPVRALLSSKLESDSASDVYADLMLQMGDLASLVEWLEFEPLPPEEGGGGAGEAFLIYPSQVLIDLLGKLERGELTLEQSGLSPEYMEETVRQAILERQRMQEAELEAVEARGEEMKLLLGSEISAPVLRGDAPIGRLKALVPPSEILREVLSRTPRDRGEVPFARDPLGTVYVDERSDKGTLRGLGIASSPEPGGRRMSNWIVVETPDPGSELVFGIARPVQESLRDFRRTAVRNFASGLGMVILALAGVLWISGRMTRKLALLTDGAESLAAGHLEARVPIRSRDELGKLARTFNRMAAQLEENQERLLAEERRRKEQEMQQRLLEAENERKSRELEEARHLQLSLLPKTLPSHPEVEVAVFMRTATEVGGDYYDFFSDERGALTTVIGDAAGHGARAGTMVTVVKGLFTAAAAEGELSGTLERATRAIKKMQLGRMNMAVSLVRIGGSRIAVSAAGMPPVLLYRERERRVEEVALAGTPLGSLADVRYQEWSSTLAPGDTVLLMSDGFPELLNGAGEPVGYPRVRSLFEHAAGRRTPREVIDRLADAAAEWNGGRPPDDDVTFVVLKMKEPSPTSSPAARSR